MVNVTAAASSAFARCNCWAKRTTKLSVLIQQEDEKENFVALRSVVATSKDDVDDENENEDFLRVCTTNKCKDKQDDDDDDDDENRCFSVARILGGGIRGRRRKRLVPVAVFENEWLWKCQSNCPSK